MKEEIFTREQRAREVKRLKMRSVRSIVLLCLACLCMSSGVYLQSAMVVSPSIWSRVVVVTLSVLLFPLSLYLLGDILKMRDYLRNFDYYHSVILHRKT